MAELSFEDRVHGVVERLSTCGIPYAVGGAIAYNYVGVPRTTYDVDVNIFLSQEKAGLVLDCLAPLGVRIEPGTRTNIERDAQVRLPWDHTFLDLFFAFAPFHESVAARIRWVPFDGQLVPILSGEDIIIFKVMFNRGRDWDDTERIIRVQGKALDRAYVRRWLTELLGADDSAVQHFEALVAAEDARGARDDT